MIREPMGRLLLDGGFISSEQLQDALDRQRQTGERLGGILVSMGAISESTLLHFLSQQYGVPTLDMPSQQVDPTLAQLIPHDQALTKLVVPVQRVGTRVTLAMADPSQVSFLDELTFRTGHHMIPVVATVSEIMSRIQGLYGLNADASSPEPSIPLLHPSSEGYVNGSKEPQAFIDFQEGSRSSKPSHPFLNPEDLSSLLEEASTSLSVTEPTSVGESFGEDQAPIVRLVDKLISPAVALEVSDIHLEPLEESVRVRYRLDGVLQTVMMYPLKLRNAVVSRLKILSNLDIAERRLPQDGRMTYHDVNRGKIDIRVSVLPCFQGEKVVLRLLDRSNLVLDLTKLGFEERDLEVFLAALEKPNGMILVTGPTGSGKTTTLYSALQHLSTPAVNIVTAEDPVEYQFTGMNQVPVRDDIGLTYPAILRAFLRQDPDIFMVGEIRDIETAHIAVRAALTGHRVLSTVHTNDAVRTITRLLDMGLDPYLVSSSVTLILAQRLVRRLCSHCREPESQSIDQLVNLGFSPTEASEVIPLRGRGCTACHFTGYRGRLGLFEVLSLSESLEALILERASPDVLKRMAKESGFTTIRQNGLKKIRAGLTSISEVVRTTLLDSRDE